MNGSYRVRLYLLAGVLMLSSTGCSPLLISEPALPNVNEDVWDASEPNVPIYDEVYGKVVVPEDVYEPEVAE